MAHACEVWWPGWGSPQWRPFWRRLLSPACSVTTWTARRWGSLRDRGNPAQARRLGEAAQSARSSSSRSGSWGRAGGAGGLAGSPSWEEAVAAVAIASRQKGLPASPGLSSQVRGVAARRELEQRKRCRRWASRRRKTRSSSASWWVNEQAGRSAEPASPVGLWGASALRVPQSWDSLVRLSGEKLRLQPPSDSDLLKRLGAEFAAFSPPLPGTLFSPRQGAKQDWQTLLRLEEFPAQPAFLVPEAPVERIWRSPLQNAPKAQRWSDLSTEDGVWPSFVGGKIAWRRKGERAYNFHLIALFVFGSLIPLEKDVEKQEVLCWAF